jgi:hypothetical protein
MTHATETVNGPAGPTLVMAMDLGRGQWRLGFAIGAGQRPRSRTIRGDEWRRLGDEIAAAKASSLAGPYECLSWSEFGAWVSGLGGETEAGVTRPRAHAKRRSPTDSPLRRSSRR